MSKIFDEAILEEECVDGYVMSYFLLDPRLIRDELKVHNLN